ncbi:tetratricopeptide repeat protein [Martelella radicis]|uniref:Tetratricopeptide repeat protein n=1 Tax=Martelella radicis TaxID=1397476 RepID=A0A7W6KFS0_9HYPH|nr:tetratricopeptide repeat protein [Martelella radicis]MBB4120302.1 hypothetical protein [Martelella radicis]
MDYHGNLITGTPSAASAGSQLSLLWNGYIRAYNLFNYGEALEYARAASRLQPGNASIWSNIAVCCLRLNDYDGAIAAAERSAALNDRHFVAFDALAHAWGEKKNDEKAGQYGLRALELREQQFGLPAEQELSPRQPPPPSPGTRDRNIIAFSLYGDRPRYCETAVMNARARADIYPDWTCRFYVDKSVPDATIAQLRDAGAEVVFANRKMREWPGPMWRFAAYDDDGLHRVIFRDADSIISARESETVEEWVESGLQFHAIRDWFTHTELLLAGLWGVAGGALPPMRLLIGRFLRTPVKSRHFADQHFLREYVWPYARRSILQHDRLFGFMDPAPLPAITDLDNHHIGANISHGGFHRPVDLADGVAVRWELRQDVPSPEGGKSYRVVCSYSTVVENGMLIEHLPRIWLDRMNKDMRVVFFHPLTGEPSGP